MSSGAVPLIIDDDTPGFGDEVTTQTGQFRHPYIVFFHLFFRSAALIVYLFCTWFTDGFIVSFVLTTILLSLDFWTVKNITGRILVGLRWWSYIDEEGNSKWVYEARKEGQGRKVLPAESRVFWMGLIVFPVLWSLLFLLAIFRFSLRWLVLDCIALSLNGANLHGYIRCKLGGGTSITGTLSSYANNLFMQQLVGNVTSVFTQKKPAAGAAANVI